MTADDLQLEASRRFGMFLLTVTAGLVTASVVVGAFVSILAN